MKELTEFEVKELRDLCAELTNERVKELILRLCSEFYTLRDRQAIIRNLVNG